MRPSSPIGRGKSSTGVRSLTEMQVSLAPGELSGNGSKFRHWASRQPGEPMAQGLTPKHKALTYISLHFRPLQLQLAAFLLWDKLVRIWEDCPLREKPGKQIWHTWRERTSPSTWSNSLGSVCPLRSQTDPDCLREGTRRLKQTIPVPETLPSGNVFV